MKCPEPNCGQPLRTFETRQRSDGIVRRSRKCSQGHRVTTLELIVTAGAARRSGLTLGVIVRA